MPAAPPALPPLDSLPGYQIRRLQQIAVGLFMDETAAHDLTPVQFAALASVVRQPGMDQRTLAGGIGLDTSTTAGVVDRLEKRGLVRREAAPDDRRVRRLVATDAGRALLTAVWPGMQRAQQRILAPLSAAERRQFMALLGRLVAANNEASRAPSRPSADG
ncbi:MarR family winged helix-turn-helix transcriptional regulator [Rubrivivax albus]|uniref:MarR family transcriptional regulator n=1 Tax=Rubrivivax albus TaxID=2499835 RepID=A0A3S3SAS5_9BURK|nr:MarR family transcriptional regulator [Rubrivivax albus]RVT49997.1 MarR family transcriptional regulator [Rubrivivax albus]